MGVLPDKAKEEAMVGDAVVVVTVVGVGVCSISVWLASPQARRTMITRRIVRLVAELENFDFIPNLEVVHRDYVGMGYACGESWFSPEGLKELGVIGDGLVDDLDGDWTVQDGVRGTIDGAESTAAYGFQVLVSADTLKHGSWRGL